MGFVKGVAVLFAGTGGFVLTIIGISMMVFSPFWSAFLQGLIDRPIPPLVMFGEPDNQIVIQGIVILIFGILLIIFGYKIGKKKRILHCHICGYIAQSDIELHNHYLKHPKDNLPKSNKKTSDDDSEILRERIVKGRDFYECISCHFKALTVSEIKKHCDDKGHEDYIFKKV